MSMDETADMSLEEMFSSLHDIHTAQQSTLTDLHSAMNAQRSQLRIADDEMKSVMQENSIFSQQLIYLTQEMRRLNDSVITDQEAELETLTEQKYHELQKSEKINSRQNELNQLMECKRKAIEQYKSQIEMMDSRYVEEADVQRLEEQIKIAEDNLKELQENCEAEEASIKMISDRLNELDIEESMLENEEKDVRAQLDRARIASSQKFNEQVNRLHCQINQLKQTQTVHRSQLKDLNRIIASQNRS